VSQVEKKDTKLVMADQQFSILQNLQSSLEFVSGKARQGGKKVIKHRDLKAHLNFSVLREKIKE